MILMVEVVISGSSSGDRDNSGGDNKNSGNGDNTVIEAEEMALTGR
jgi:hypothetical protein